MTLVEFIEKTYNIIEPVTGLKLQTTRPRIICNDGFSLSVQCSEMTYCTPRTNSKTYQEVEVGYPSEVELVLLKYAESREDPTKTVYGYVPVELVQQVIDKHGGIDVEAIFPGLKKSELELEIKKINEELINSKEWQKNKTKKKKK